MVPEPDGVEWDKRTLLMNEKEILKMYVSDHPLRPYEDALARITKHRMGDLSERENGIKDGVFVGMISEVATRLTRTGKKMATFRLEDTTGAVECICFRFEKHADVIRDDAIVKVVGNFEVNARGNQIVVGRIEELQVEAFEANDAPRAPSHLQLRVPSAEFNQTKSMRLNRILKAYPGRDNVVLFVDQSDGRKFRAELPVTVDARATALRSELCELFGRQALIA